MSIARSIARPVASRIASRTTAIGGGGSPAYDPDALDYFSRAEALGGSFDQSGINATYTEAYVKQAISNFIAGCKTDAIWTKLTEVYLLGGVTFGGLMAKLKHAGTATLTNTGPFVTGDYLASGSGAGLQGNGSTKFLRTSYNLPSSLTEISLSAYLASADGSGGRGWIGAAVSADGAFLGRAVSGNNDTFQFCTVTGSYADVPAGTRDGFFIGSATSLTDRVLYRNGVSIASSSSSAAPTVTEELCLFSVRNTGVTLSAARIAFAHIGTGLTPTDVGNLSTRVTALLMAIGANVY